MLQHFMRHLIITKVALDFDDLPKVRITCEILSSSFLYSLPPSVHLSFIRPFFPPSVPSVYIFTESLICSRKCSINNGLSADTFGGTGRPGREYSLSAPPRKPVELEEGMGLTTGDLCALPRNLDFYPQGKEEHLQGLK